MGTPAHADFVLEGFGASSWDRTNNPAASPLMTLQISPNPTPGIDEIYGFSLGLRFVPQASASGTLALSSASEPTANSVFTYEPGAPILFEVEPGVFTISASKDEFTNTQITATRNLISFTANSPLNDASGLFDIYAVPDYTSFFRTTDFDGIAFGNVPFAGGDVFLGTINASITAVPEPTSLILVSLAASAGHGVRYRQLRGNKKKRSDVRKGTDAPQGV